MEKYNLIIKDNETGEIKIDKNVNAIIAGLSDGETSNALSITACNGFDLCTTLYRTEEAINETLSVNPVVKPVYELYKAFIKSTKNEETEEIPEVK